MVVRMLPHLSRKHDQTAVGVAAYGVYSLAVTSDPAQAVGQLGHGILLTSFGAALYGSPLMWIIVLAPLALVFFLSFRIGKQEVVWGESDNFRLMDRVNPLDVTWHLQQENWVDLRKPLTMIKALYKIGDVDPIHESFLEVYWGLGDWTPIER